MVRGKQRRTPFAFVRWANQRQRKQSLLIDGCGPPKPRRNNLDLSESMGYVMVHNFHNVAKNSPCLP